MPLRARFLACLLLADALRFAAAAELVVVIESPPFPLETRLAAPPVLAALVVSSESPAFVLDTRVSGGHSTLATLVVMAESSAFTLDTRLAAPPALAALVVSAESPAFVLDTRLSGGNSTLATLVVMAESGAFTLDTRLATGSPILATLVVTVESGAFTLDTRLSGRREDLIVQFESPPFELNTLWIGIRKISRARNSLLELFWPTNAAEFPFHPQGADAPLNPPLTWQNLPDPITESGGYFRVPLAPDSTNHYFRLKL
jgi:hypothetical protein